MNALPKLCALDNRGVHGMDHCFGAPFIAKDFDTAKEMVKDALGDKKDLVNLKDFYLVELAAYDITSDAPVRIPNDSSFLEFPCCVADLFLEEEGEISDEVAYCGTDAFKKESGITDEQE